ncbi:MAG TPA: A/G-specific adenine glycosylase [Candidatus Saccharimonadia bacterium]|nr:A/G-specific adenine glycosylase [Candidatus Saccharimonadia bacterium]
MDERVIVDFRERVWEFYREQGRDLPWRREVTPYGVFVSEVMLQQTQVSRVLGHWPRWLERFGSFEALAAASVAEVVEAWQGLGYNRRALWLREAAQMVVREFGGVLPRDPAELVRLPGIGPNTAGSIAAFAYDEPVVFIETNIRRVFLHEFFEDSPALCASYPDGVPDAVLRPLIEAALDRQHPREWYWALMDYGADLAKRVVNPNRRSRHYAVQSTFAGSVRQLRGEVLRRLLDGPKRVRELGIGDERLPAVLAALVREGFLIEKGDTFGLAK